jgi:mannose/fructose/N-acetylgalactosamine-specific phosphotransferase system component IIC
MIKSETKQTKLVAFSSLLFTIVMAILSFVIYKNKASSMNNTNIENIFIILNIFVILLLIAILSIKKTIYYSKRLIKEGSNLEQVLQQWRKVDIILILTVQIIPVIGLSINIFGMEFRRTTHFFIASFLLVVMLMPMGIKVRSKLRLLKDSFTNIL